MSMNYLTSKWSLLVAHFILRTEGVKISKLNTPEFLLLCRQNISYEEDSNNTTLLCALWGLNQKYCYQCIWFILKHKLFEVMF